METSPGQNDIYQAVESQSSEPPGEKKAFFSSYKYIRGSKAITTLETIGDWYRISPAIVPGIAPVSYWPIFFPVPTNSPISLCES